jgi:hypothetical protein
LRPLRTLAAAGGFLTVEVIALVGQKLGGHAGEYGLLLGIAGVAEVFGALLIARLHLRNLALTAVLAGVLLGVFCLPLGLASSPLIAAGLHKLASEDAFLRFRQPR